MSGPLSVGQKIASLELASTFQSQTVQVKSDGKDFGSVKEAEAYAREVAEGASADAVLVKDQQNRIWVYEVDELTTAGGSTNDLDTEIRPHIASLQLPNGASLQGFMASYRAKGSTAQGGVERVLVDPLAAEKQAVQISDVVEALGAVGIGQAQVRMLRDGASAGLLARVRSRVASNTGDPRAAALLARIDGAAESLRKSGRAQMPFDELATLAPKVDAPRGAASPSKASAMARELESHPEKKTQFITAVSSSLAEIATLESRPVAGLQEVRARLETIKRAIDAKHLDKAATAFAGLQGILANALNQKMSSSSKDCLLRAEKMLEPMFVAFELRTPALKAAVDNATASAALKSRGDAPSQTQSRTASTPTSGTRGFLGEMGDGFKRDWYSFVAGFHEGNVGFYAPLAGLTQLFEKKTGLPDGSLGSKFLAGAAESEMRYAQAADAKGIDQSTFVGSVMANVYRGFGQAPLAVGEAIDSFGAGAALGVGGAVGVGALGAVQGAGQTAYATHGEKTGEVLKSAMIGFFTSYAQGLALGSANQLALVQRLTAAGVVFSASALVQELLKPPGQRKYGKVVAAGVVGMMLTSKNPEGMTFSEAWEQIKAANSLESYKSDLAALKDQITQAARAMKAAVEDPTVTTGGAVAQLSPRSPISLAESWETPKSIPSSFPPNREATLAKIADPVERAWAAKMMDAEKEINADVLARLPEYVKKFQTEVVPKSDWGKSFETDAASRLFPQLSDRTGWTEGENPSTLLNYSGIKGGQLIAREAFKARASELAAQYNAQAEAALTRGETPPERPILVGLFGGPCSGKTGFLTKSPQMQKIQPQIGAIFDSAGEMAGSDIRGLVQLGKDLGLPTMIAYAQKDSPAVPLTNPDWGIVHRAQGPQGRMVDLDLTWRGYMATDDAIREMLTNGTISPHQLMAINTDGKVGVPLTAQEFLARPRVDGQALRNSAHEVSALLNKAPTVTRPIAFMSRIGQYFGWDHGSSRGD